MSRQPSHQDQPFPFEQALAELNTLVSQMEQGDLSLEQSLALFEQGIGLTQHCQKALQSAQQKVQQLVEKQGKLTLDDFDINHVSD